MSSPPEGQNTLCPECGATATAVVPKRSTIVEDEEAADGKVSVRCQQCEERFVVYYTAAE